MKTCSRCKETKPFDAFHRSRKERDGYQYKCKQCKSQKVVDLLAIKGFRQCLLCKQIKTLKDNFYERKKNSGRYRSQCKSCYVRRSIETRDPIKRRNTMKQYYYKIKPYKNNLDYKLRLILRTRLNMAIRNNQKVGSAVQDLGCSIGEFKLYIENQFEEDMSWENFGEWHLDHVIPLKDFDLTNRMEFLEACNWLNIRPLWARDNLARNKKYDN